MKKFIGIDNGVTGGITALDGRGVVLLHINTPVKKCLNYTKTKQWINRVDSLKFKEAIQSFEDSFCYIERPMVNPGRFKATISAIRCLEATQLILEELNIPYEFIDSKQWQKVLLPSGLEKDELKAASVEVSKRLFPKIKLCNSDSLLIAEFCRREKR